MNSETKALAEKKKKSVCLFLHAPKRPVVIALVQPRLGDVAYDVACESLCGRVVVVPTFLVCRGARDVRGLSRHCQRH
jgi:hypothetical protein